jgi:hypothetical protein
MAGRARIVLARLIVEQTLLLGRNATTGRAELSRGPVLAALLTSSKFSSAPRFHFVN